MFSARRVWPFRGRMIERLWTPPGNSAGAAAPWGTAIAAAGHGAASVASGDLALIQIVAERSGAGRAWTLPAGRDRAAQPGPLGVATRAARERVAVAAAQAIGDGRCDA